MIEDLTRKFAALLRAAPGLDTQTTAMARLLVVDGLAVAAAGSREPGPRILAAAARDRACPAVATVIAQGLATSPEHAARINGTAMHVLDYEAMWNPPNHAISTILPALLALAEVREAADFPPQGERLLAALVIGIEAQGRLRLASRQIEPRSLSLHPPGVVGPIAAAAACAHLLELEESAQVAAIGIAASRACGLMANVGSMTKALHCGDAAMHGLDAALLAARGFTSDRDALGGPRGFGAAYFGDRFDADALLAPARMPRLLEPGPAWKLFPSQFGTHFAITAALEARGKLQGAAAVDVTVRSPVMPYIDRPRPSCGLDGKSSLQYCVAAALLDGRVDLATFSDRRRFETDMEAMLGKIRLVQDPAIPAGFDTMHVDVCVTVADGREVTCRCTAPLGSWSRPVESARVEAKAKDLLVEAFGEEGWRSFRAAIERPSRELRVSGWMAAVRDRLAEGVEVVKV